MTTLSKKIQEKCRLAAAEARAVALYGDKIVIGSVQRGKGRHLGKITVEIKTRGLDGQYDGHTRRVATSDLHLVNHMPGVASELRRLRKTEQYAAGAL